MSMAKSILSKAVTPGTPTGPKARPPGTPLPPGLRPAAGRGKGMMPGSPGPSPAGRARGPGPPSNTSMASMGSQIVQSVMSSSPRSIIGDGPWEKGRKVFLKEVGPEPPATKARGTIEEVQKDNVIVSCDPPWDATHPRGPYSKQRLRLLPPTNANVEIRGHSNAALNGRAGVVVMYDAAREGYQPKPDGLRVSLFATPAAPTQRVLVNFTQLKPSKGPTPTSESPGGGGAAPPGTPRTPRNASVTPALPASPIATRGPPDQAQYMFQGLQADEGAEVPAEELAEGLRKLTPAEEFRWRPINVQAAIEALDSLAGVSLSEQEFVSALEGGGVLDRPAVSNDTPRPPLPPESVAKPAMPSHQKVPSMGEFTDVSAISDTEHTGGRGNNNREEQQKMDQRMKEVEERENLMAAREAMVAEAEAARAAELTQQMEEREKAMRAREAQLEAQLKEQLRGEAFAARLAELEEQETAGRRGVKERQAEGRAAVAQRREDSEKFLKSYVSNMTQAMQVMEGLKAEIAVLKDTPPTPAQAPAQAKPARGAAVPTTPRAAELSAAAAPLSPGAESPRTASALWGRFESALAESGASVDDISHTTEGQLLTLLTGTLQFSQLDALRVVNMWPEKRPGGRRQRSRTPRRDADRDANRDFNKACAKIGRARRGSIPPSETESMTSDGTHFDGASQSDRPVKSTGRRVILPPHAQEHIMVSEVLKHTTTSGDLSVKITRIVQLQPSPSMLKRYERSKKHLESGFQSPKVLYYSGPTMPSIAEVLQRGFHDELRRSRCLQFSTEANVETAARSADSEIVMLLLCEVVAGRVHKLKQGPLSLVQRQVGKVCGPPNPPKGKTYAADSVGMEYTYTDRRGEVKSATRFAITDPDRVIPRYLVYLAVSGDAGPAGLSLGSPQRGGPMPSPSALLHAGSPRHATRMPEDVMHMSPPRPLVSSFPSFGAGLGFIASPTPAQLPASEVVMCPLHPKEELRLYCNDEEELTCSMCASVGRHAGKRCQPLGELLQSMRPHLHVHEKQIGTRLSHLEATVVQLQKQGERMKEAELRARREIRRRTAELQEEVNARAEHMEQDLTTRAADASAKMQDALRRAMERTVLLRQAHERVGALVGPGGPKNAAAGVSTKAADIITLSRLLEQLKHTDAEDLADAERLSLSVTEDVHNELLRLRLPPAPVGTPTSRPYGLASPYTGHPIL
eukprot:TRINITY_DN18472_c0_g1_i1.p1 TRINITY_DN18472_c0_g1~~TRINITY_DN18472_c0_g1_i1.p1  ORF type:complete len:1325 (+),score=389.84 TRINITY_DN18472_c0_g1_i1:378-3977(+)